MVVAMSYALALLGPDLAALGDGRAGRMPLGIGEYVGTVRLADATGRPVPVRLFVDDSDAAGGLRAYPNSLDLHAVYRSGDGSWGHRRLASYARVKFLRVKERAARSAVLEVRPDWRADGKDRTDGRDVNAPFIRRLTLRGGLPVLGD